MSSIAFPKPLLWLPKPRLWLKAGGGYPCCCGRCDYCTGELPDIWRVILSGIAEDGCGSCDSLNGIWDIEIGVCHNPAATITCGGCVHTDICTTTMLRVMWGPPSKGVWVDLYCRTPWYGQIVKWEKAFDPLPVCKDLDGEDIPFVTQKGWWKCDATASTCTLTAL